MKFAKFTAPNGDIVKYVNLDSIDSATPYGKDQVMLKTPTGSFAVDKKQFEEAISKKSDDIDKLAAISRNIINALDRLSGRIPSSIRMHM